MITESAPTDHDSSDPRTQRCSAASTAPSFESFMSGRRGCRGGRGEPPPGTAPTPPAAVPRSHPKDPAFSRSRSTAAAPPRWPADSSGPAAGPSTSATGTVQPLQVPRVGQPLTGDGRRRLRQRHRQITQLRGHRRGADSSSDFGAPPQIGHRLRAAERRHIHFCPNSVNARSVLVITTRVAPTAGRNSSSASGSTALSNTTSAAPGRVSRCSRSRCADFSESPSGSATPTRAAMRASPATRSSRDSAFTQPTNPSPGHRPASGRRRRPPGSCPPRATRSARTPPPPRARRAPRPAAAPSRGRTKPCGARGIPDHHGTLTHRISGLGNPALAFGAAVRRAIEGATRRCTTFSSALIGCPTWCARPSSAQAYRIALGERCQSFRRARRRLAWTRSRPGAGDDQQVPPLESGRGSSRRT